MEIAIRNITFDCTDALALAGFWSRLTGWNVYSDDDPEVLVAPCFPHAGTGFLFIPVPEGKTAKNRVHLDLQPSGLSRDAAVDRAVELGATIIGDFRTPDGRGWVTLADPEGNEFCLEPSTEERAAVAGPRHFTIGVASS